MFAWLGLDVLNFGHLIGPRASQPRTHAHTTHARTHAATPTLMHTDRIKPLRPSAAASANASLHNSSPGHTAFTSQGFEAARQASNQTRSHKQTSEVVKSWYTHSRKPHMGQGARGRGPRSRSACAAPVAPTHHHPDPRPAVRHSRVPPHPSGC